ncbi:hypothetical protein [Bradyrhizobium sp. ARR65]|nr:hypothetical protein [Bradyrhizobium sp. ARR65]
MDGIELLSKGVSQADDFAHKKVLPTCGAINCSEEGEIDDSPK